MKYIDADALSESVNALLRRADADEKAACLFAMSMLANAPAVDVAPMRHGTWKREKGRDFIKCSSCGFKMFPLDAYQKGEWPNMCVTFCNEQKYIPCYCPDCGARMDLEESK